MDQDETWHEGRPQPGHIVLDGDPAPPKRGTHTPNFRPMSVVAKRLDGQDATWYGGRPRPRWHCVRWDPTSPKKVTAPPPHFSAHVYCGQMARRINMPLGMEVDLSPGHIVLVGTLLPRPERDTAPAPLNGPCLLRLVGYSSLLLLSTCYSILS